MSRRTLLIAMATLCCAAIAAGWFAVNAPEASRPSFTNLGAVRLPQEIPPTPPSPLERGLIDVSAGGARMLFAAQSGALTPAGPPLETAPGEHGFRAVLAPMAAAPVADLAALATPKAPRDDFQAAFGFDPPSHSQYFGGHLIPEEARRSDASEPKPEPKEEGPTFVDASEDVAPREPPLPKIGPRRAEALGLPAESPAVASKASEEPAAADAPPSASAAAGAPTAGSAPGDPTRDAPSLDAAAPGRIDGIEDAFILLGVLMRPGDDRALIRTAGGESRRVSLGDEVAGGWRVSEIGESFIRVRRGAQTREIRIPD